MNENQVFRGPLAAHPCHDGHMVGQSACPPRFRAWPYDHLCPNTRGQKCTSSKSQHQVAPYFLAPLPSLWDNEPLAPEDGDQCPLPPPCSEQVWSLQAVLGRREGGKGMPRITGPRDTCATERRCSQGKHQCRLSGDGVPSLEPVSQPECPSDRS